MSDRKHFIAIWFFIGLLLGVYGILILGAGLYDVFNPPKAIVENGIERNVLAHLHTGVWWGLLLLVLGLFYSIHFRPGKEK